MGYPYPVFCLCAFLGPYNVGVISTQRAQYPVIKEYGLNYIGLHILV